MIFEKPGTSKSSKGLMHMKKFFERTEDFSNFRLHVNAGFRMKSDRFRGGDILLKMKVQELPNHPEVLAEDILLGVYHSLDDLIEKLKSEFDDSERRMIFIDDQNQAFTVPLLLGSFMLHNQQNGGSFSW